MAKESAHGGAVMEKNRMQFRTRLAVVVGLMAFLWTLIIVGALATYTAITARKAADRTVEGRIESVAIAAASMINGDAHQAVIDQGTESTPEYQSMVAGLRQIQDAYNARGTGEIDCIYTFWRDKADPMLLHFGVDTSTGDRHSLINSTYEDPATKALLETYRTRKAHSDPVTRDSYGIAKTAYAAVEDSSGKVVAVVAVDLNTTWPPLITPMQIFFGILVIVISTLAGIVMAGALYPALTNQITSLAMVANKVAEGDLTANTVGIEMHREFANLGESLQAMILSLRSLVGRAQSGAATLHKWSETLRDASAHAGRGAGEVARMLSEAAAGVDSLANSSARVADELTAINDLAENVSDKTDSASSTMTGTLERATRSISAADEAAGRVQAAATTLNATAGEIREFGQWADEISKTAGFITRLSEEIALLAMNAQIEAARAGERGSGAAILADKVKSFASETAQFAARIAEVNREMTARLPSIASAIARTDEGMSSSTSLLRGAMQMLDEILADLRSMAGQLTAIAGSAAELSLRTKSGKEQTDAMAGYTVEAAASLEEISAGSEEQAALAEEVVTAVTQLHELADQLEQEIKRFKLT